ncbi:MAG: PHP domain-containing protein [Bacilli bacterium]
MKFYYDLHIHSILSPCGDYLMTPNNILNMATLTNLNVIAITDHNSTMQCPAFKMLSSSFDMLIIYGCELQVEGGHLLVYFKKYEEINKFQEYLNSIIKKEKYDIEYYGEQTVMNEYDIETKIYPYYLVNDLDTSLSEILEVLRGYHCIKILAHLDKPTTSLLNIIKQENSDDIDGIELINSENLEKIVKVCPFLKNKNVIYNSDAHNIAQINDSDNYFEIDQLSIDNVFEVFKNE